MILDTLSGNGLLIHHWDTDGICSARLLLAHLSNKSLDNKTPLLGNYYLTKEELQSYAAYDFVIIADMNLPKDNILTLAEHAKVLIFDHHLGQEISTVFHHNPVINGEDANDYPSASWIINTFLGNDINLFAILGIIGDHEQNIKNNPVFQQRIAGFCRDHSLAFDELHKMVYLLDSNYKVGDKQAVEHAPRFLLEHDTSVAILHNKEWNKKYNALNQEMEKQLHLPDEMIGDIILKKIHTTYNIISTITRNVSWSSGKNTVVINTGFFPDKNQVYVRSNKNLEPMIMRGKALGLKCGGKKEVLGAIVPKKQTDLFVDEIIKFLTG